MSLISAFGAAVITVAYGPEAFVFTRASSALANAVVLPVARAATIFPTSSAPLSRCLIPVMGLGMPPPEYPGTPTAANASTT